jgi:hypothetical protein
MLADTGGAGDLIDDAGRSGGQYGVRLLREKFSPQECANYATNAVVHQPKAIGLTASQADRALALS